MSLGLEAIESLLKENIVAQSDVNGKRVWLCIQCNYSQKGRKDVEKHYERIHLKSVRLSCPICSNVVNSQVDLQTHIRNFHPPSLLLLNASYISYEIPSALRCVN